MIDRALVEQKLKLIRADLEELAREKPADYPEYLRRVIAFLAQTK